jgi:hypothetical protein
MLLCAAGDIHGALERLYDDVLAFELALGRRFEAVLHVGDFGIWPDAASVDRATQEHEGAGDFPEWRAEDRAVSRRTVFIKGNHEDFGWLEALRDAEALPGLVYLPNGHVHELDDEQGRERIRIGGIGGCFGPSNYERPSARLRGYARRHFTHDEVDRLAGHGVLDVLLLHDAPAGVEFVRRRRHGEQRYVS